MRESRPPSATSRVHFWRVDGGGHHNTAQTATHSGPITPNTVQLVWVNGVVGWVVRLGPVCVMCAFDMPFGHFAFDHAGCRSPAARRAQAVEQSSQEGPPVQVGSLGTVRGKRRPGGRRIAV